MHIAIDPHSPVPIYQQIRDCVVEMIAAGELRTGERLVSIRGLAGQLGVNIETVYKAYDLLRNDGFLITNDKSGSRIVSGLDRADVTIEDLPEGWSARFRVLVAEALATGLSSRGLNHEVENTVTEFLNRQRASGLSSA